MTTKYGYSISDWDKAKEEMRKNVIEKAKLRRMIPYSEMVKKTKTISLEPESYALAAMKL